MVVRVVTDSTADLEAEVAARQGITVVPLRVHFGDEVFQDGVSLSKDEFYRRLAGSAILPRTSQPPAAAFQEAYVGLREAEAIVSVHIGGKLSGTVNAARLGARLLGPGGAPVEVVDTDQVSMGVGHAALAAAEAAAGGAGAAAVAAAAREGARRSRVLLFVDTLEYLQKGGRIGRARALLGTMLRTKTLLQLVDGEIEGIARPRTRQGATERLLELIVQTPRPQRVSILYGTTLREAEALAGRVREALPGVAVSMVQVSPVIGVHTGPAALGAAILEGGE